MRRMAKQLSSNLPPACIRIVRSGFMDKKGGRGLNALPRAPLRSLGCVVLFTGLSLFTSGCAGLNDGFGGGYNGGGYNSGYYGGGGYGYGDGYYDRRERERLRNERERLEDERERLERERERQPVYVPPYQPPPPPQQYRPPPQVDRCPSGFSPSEQKCSPAERRNGCRDIRLPSGLGCVDR